MIIHREVMRCALRGVVTKKKRKKKSVHRRMPFELCANKVTYLRGEN